MMSEHDRQLVDASRSKCWEAIDEDAAETPEGKAALHDIIMRKFHRDEYRNGML